MTSLASQELSTEPPRVLSPAELERRHAESFPEALGPGTDHESGAVSYAQERDPRIGAVPHLLDPQTVAAENAERQARLDAMSPLERQIREDVEAMVRQEMRHHA
jgi:hypothetical protein